MFEKAPLPEPSEQSQIYLAGGEPIEFTYRGRRFRIHAVLSSWREAGGWWNRAKIGRAHV